MNKISFEESYNERLFNSKNIRSFFHNARFHWIRKVCQNPEIDYSRLFEIGCFDGRLLDYLDHEPKEYIGVDADWEGGLTEAIKQRTNERCKFINSTSHKSLQVFPKSHFACSIAMETLEHLPPDLTNAYLDEIHRITDGHFIATIPNEKGMVFLAKYLGKKLFLEGTQNYQFSEVINATLGRMHKIERDDHKGFDYQHMIKQIGTRFKIISIQPVPFSFLPSFTGFTIGIIAKSIK